jgi:hypothetical protein
VTGLELVVRYLVAWGGRRARQVAEFAESDADQALDAALDHLHQAVSDKLGSGRALAASDKESSIGEVSARTRQRLLQLLTAAADEDSVFSTHLAKLVEQVRQAERAAGIRLTAAAANGVTV